uniref:Uncharacterized protein n=1 Tax=Sphaerodactylus townsendi TaxID=933632 RepID=A0ACB8EC80_9SAUR
MRHSGCLVAPAHTCREKAHWHSGRSHTIPFLVLWRHRGGSLSIEDEGHPSPSSPPESGVQGSRRPCRDQSFPSSVLMRHLYMSVKRQLDKTVDVRKPLRPLKSGRWLLNF